MLKCVLHTRIVPNTAKIAQALQGHHQVLQQQEDHNGAGKDPEASRPFPEDHLIRRIVPYIKRFPGRPTKKDLAMGACFEAETAEQSGSISLHHRSPCIRTPGKVYVGHAPLGAAMQHCERDIKPITTMLALMLAQCSSGGARFASLSLKCVPCMQNCLESCQPKVLLLGRRDSQS